MPCYDSRDHESSERMQELQDKVNTLTRLLCKATARLKDNKLLEEGEELFKWEQAHEKVDRARANKNKR